MSWWLSCILLFFPVLLSGLLVFFVKISDKGLKLILNFSDSLVVGIILNNIPISIAFMTMLLHMGMGRNKAIGYLVLFALMAPLGCMLSQTLNYCGINNFEQFLKISLAVVIGIFLH